MSRLTPAAILAVLVSGWACAPERSAQSPAPSAEASQVPATIGIPLGEVRDRKPAPETGVAFAEVVDMGDIADRQDDFPVAIVDGQVRGRSRIRNGLTDEDIARLMAEAMALPSSADRMPPLGPATLVQGVNFDSIDSNECCGGGTVTPPDPETAAGPNHLIAVVNLSLEIYDKTGTPLVGPLTFASFFSPLGSDCAAGFDPNVLYDEAEDRFVIGVDGNGVEYCIAVSQTADPTGAYWLYSFATNVGGAFFDYPHAGVGLDAIYVGANLFGSGQGRAWAFDKAAMYVGAPTLFVSQPLPAGHTTPQPLNLHGFSTGTWPTGGPHYFVASDGFTAAAAINLYTWTDPFGANAFTQVADLDFVAEHGVAVGSPIDSPQQGGSSITGNDPRLLDFEFHDGSGWTTSTVSCNPGGGTVNCLQWGEIDLASGTFVQAGVVGTNGVYRYFPDLAVDACGNAAIGFTRSNSGEFPGVWAVGRSVADPPGTFQADVSSKAGDTTHSTFANRWGDYTGMTVDPDGGSFWYLGEYSKNNGNVSSNWGDWMSEFSMGCSPSIFEDGFESGDTSSWTTTID